MAILSPFPYQFFLKHLPLSVGNYLEIGVYDGDMLKDFAVRWPDNMFYGVDPFISDGDTMCHHGTPIGERMEKQRTSSHANFKDVPNIKFFEQTSASFAAEKTDAELKAMNLGSVYIDGSHTYENALNDLELALRCLKKDGVVLMDDAGLPAVSKAFWDFISTHPGRFVEPYKLGFLTFK